MTLQIPNRKVTALQNLIDGGVPVQANYLVINERCFTPVIEALNQKELLDKKKLTCKICSEIVDEKNIRAIVPRKEEIDYLCVKVHCIDEYFYGRVRR